MENEASSEQEKKLCNNVKRYYEGLKFLQYAANKKIICRRMREEGLLQS